MNVTHPYSAYSRKFIDRLIEVGYLGEDERHSTEAIERAIAELMNRTKDVFAENSAASSEDLLEVG